MTLELRDVTKTYPTRSGAHTVLARANLRLERGEKLGILGRNGAGKSTLLRLLAGSERPSSGTIERQMSVSWPLAFAGGFQGTLTGLDNVRFVARVYGADPQRVDAFVEDFAELGKFLREPVRTYSSGMRARLAFAISMAIEFDCFLIDEVISVGDARFHEKCRIELFGRRADRAMVIVSHEPHNIREHCDHVAVLHMGRLHPFQSVSEAYAFYEANARQPAA